jgi:hypothetical protein
MLWSLKASNWLGLRLPAEPLKRQIVKVHPARPLQTFYFGYGVAKSLGVVFLRTTEERTGFDRGATIEARDEILAFGRVRVASGGRRTHQADGAPATAV